MKDKRSQIVSLFSVITIVSFIFCFIAIAVNWNLFYVLGGLLLILFIGIGIIFMPSVFRVIYGLTYRKMDKRIKDIEGKIRESLR